MIRPDTPYFFTMGPHSFQWFRLQSVYTVENKKTEKLQVKVNSLVELIEGAGKIELENTILPPYIKTTNWFVGKNRQLHSITILEVERIDLEISDAFFSSIQVI